MQLIPQVVVAMAPSSLVSKKSLTDNAHSCSSCPSRRVCISRDLEEQETGEIERLVAKTRRVAKHATLCRKNDRLTTLFLVRFGQFKLIGEDLSGEQRIAGFYMAGDVMGMDAIATGRHQYRIMALENSEVCEMPFGHTTDMMSAQPALQRRLFQAMSESLNSHCCRSIMLAKAPVDARLANFLLTMSKKFGNLGYSDRLFRLSMSRGDIGSYLGTTIETVSRLISRFNAHGAVSILGRMVELRDQCYLEGLVSGNNETETPSVAAKKDSLAPAAAVNVPPPPSSACSMPFGVTEVPTALAA